MSEVSVHILYPPYARKQAMSVATVFLKDNINVKTIEKQNIENITIIGPTFATTDVTKATALLRRYLLTLKRHG